jgi:ABC-type transport system substrate-binding protein
MKLKTKIGVIISTVLLISMSTPFISVFASALNTAQAERVSFVWGAGGVGGDLGRWDPACATTTQFGALEPMIWMDTDYNLHPLLATSWTVYPRPDEGGNTGGVKAISFTLRENVTFMDGSEWNATVAKWNWDRCNYISGYNITNWKSRYWFNPAAQEPYFTANWNLSWYKNDPFGIGVVPIINESIVVSDYVINFTLNKWRTETAWFGNLLMISMDTYKDYFYEGILGYGDDPAYPASEVPVLIGTGPYKFEWVDAVVSQSALASKNEDYWNKTALEARGLFVVEDSYTQWYSTPGARTNALIAGDTDASSWMLQAQLTDLPALNASILHELYPAGYDPSIDCITMLGTEGCDVPLYGIPTWLAAYGINTTALEGLTLREMFPTLAPLIGQAPGTELPGGVNRTVRRAISYAFDVDNYVDVSYANVGGIKCTTPLSQESIYYDPSVPVPYYDLTKARQILLDDPYYAAQLAARNLGVGNSSAEWQAVAMSNPIRTYQFLGTVGSVKPSFLTECLHNLAFGVVVTEIDNMYTDWMSPGKTLMYDMWSYIWLNDARFPLDFFGSGMNLLYNSRMMRLPYFGYNFAMVVNSTIDNYLADIPFQGGMAQQHLFNNLSYDLMNYHYPWIYLGNAGLGFAANAGWEFAPRSINPTGVPPYMPYIGGSRMTVAPPEAPIPGYSLVALTIFGLISVVGITYVMKKRKKL